ncbi:MAG: GNAT family N-acetyltransferase [Ruminococcaceae bacterium]|nr:GNAT family N-acetyltransferase [Oscillospiraceae bacterium]
MIDKSLPKFLVGLEKFDAGNYPHCELPEGYTVHMYEPNMGYEDAFARMWVACGQFVDFNNARAVFVREFLSTPELDPHERCLFIKAPDGEIMATCSMWMGTDLDETPTPRMHYLIVGDGHEGKGIARALVSKMMELHQKLEQGDYVYLTTTSWNFHAINIYLDFGFKPCMNKKPRSKALEAIPYEEWVKTNAERWDMLLEKMNAYRARKGKAPYRLSE